MSEETTETKDLTEYVKLIRGQRGGYGWEIKALDVEKAIKRDEELRQKYGGSVGDED